jgi:hypothetical protein
MNLKEFFKHDNLDEMQKQTLLKIESCGFWALWVLLLAALYVTPLRIPKPGLAAICLLSAVGALELAGLILAALGRL